MNYISPKFLLNSAIYLWLISTNLDKFIFLDKFICQDYLSLTISKNFYLFILGILNSNFQQDSKKEILTNSDILKEIQRYLIGNLYLNVAYIYSISYFDLLFCHSTKKSSPKKCSIVNGT